MIPASHSKGWTPPPVVHNRIAKPPIRTAVPDPLCPLYLLLQMVQGSYTESPHPPSLQIAVATSLPRVHFPALGSSDILMRSVLAASYGGNSSGSYEFSFQKERKGAFRNHGPTTNKQTNKQSSLGHKIAIHPSCCLHFYSIHFLHCFQGESTTFLPVWLT